MLLSFERELTETHADDYDITCEASLSQTEVMLYNKLTFVNISECINNDQHLLQHSLTFVNVS